MDNRRVKYTLPYYNHIFGHLYKELIEKNGRDNLSVGARIRLISSKEFQECKRIAFNKWMSARKKFKIKRKWKCR